MGETLPKEEEIHELLLEVGISPSSYGFQYITYALQLIMTDASYLHRITSRLYIAIADRYKVTSCSVERNIRHAVARAFTVCCMDFAESLFRNCINPNTGVPTNSQLFARLYFYLVNNYAGKSA